MWIGGLYQTANPFLLEGITIGLIIQKFGGSSVRDAERLGRVCGIIAAAKKAGHRVAAVFSAQGDTTDRLVEKARELSAAPPRRELDALLTTGECASVALGAIALCEMGVPAVSLTAAQLPLRTDSEHGNARILHIDTRRIHRELEDGKVVLVAGFQGVDKGNNLTTLGRGGSDLTAVALASCLRADRCCIYTDVDGIYTTDPRVCPTARRLPKISYAHMLALAGEGAQVLHDRSVEFAARHGVELEVLSCEAGSVGSRVVETADCGPVTGLTRKRTAHGTVITAVGRALPGERGALARKALQGKLLDIIDYCEGNERFSITVDPAAADRALCLVHDALFDT